MSDQTAIRRIAHWLMPCVGIASLLGGSVFWLRRVGWLQSDRYWRSNMELAQAAPNPDDAVAVHAFVMAHHASLHQVEGWWLLTKLAKEAVLAAFMLLALLAILRARPKPAFRSTFLGLFAFGALSAATAALAGGWMALAAGVRAFASWIIGRGALAWIDDGVLQHMARTCAWVLVAQAALVAIESHSGMLVYSINLFGSDLVRVVGSFNLPISLGTFAVVTWAAIRCWSGYSRATLLLSTVLLCELLLVNASATAWVAFLLAVAIEIFVRLRRGWRFAFLLSALPATLLAWQALPTLTGRWDVHDSLWGRIAPVHAYASDRLSTRQWLFGTGFGLGTNALGRQETSVQPASAALPDRPVGDSMPAALFWQIGLVGLALVYALFALALRADARSRPIGVALLVCSLGVNITELFPVNLILGFWLANAMRGGHDDAPT